MNLLRPGIIDARARYRAAARRLRSTGLARLLYRIEILHPPGHPCQLPYSGTRQNGHHVSVVYAYMYMSMHVNTIVQKVDIRCKLRCACFESRYEMQHEVRMQVNW